MVKKSVKRTSVKASKDIEKLNTILIENFVKLQKAITNLTVKFDSLSGEISSLLQLFEISAKSFAEKLATSTPDIEKDKEFLEKLDKIINQNKVIAKGLTLMEDKMKERLYGAKKPTQRPIYRPAPKPNPLPQQGYLPSTTEERKTKELE